MSIDKIKKLFALRLKDVLTEKKIDAEELAASVGVSAATVYAWRSAKNLPERKYESKLANFLGVPEDWLMGRSGGFESLEDLPEWLAQDLEAWTKGTGIDKREFIFRCLDKYGQQFCDELITERFQRRKGVSSQQGDRPSVSAAASEALRVVSGGRGKKPPTDLPNDENEPPNQGGRKEGDVPR